MDQDQIDILELLFQEGIEGVVILIEVNVKLGIRPAKIVYRLNGSFAFVLHQIAERPCPEFFVGAHLMTKFYQRAREPAQEMSIAVVPI
jgi:hypothetical protein